MLYANVNNYMQLAPIIIVKEEQKVLINVG